MANEIPVFQRQVQAQTNEVPNFGNEFRQMAAEQNSLSAIGAHVAQVASNQMATQLGYESGKHPNGDLTPPLTEFDRNFAQSYHAQAYATLSTQANKLFSDAEIELSKSTRLTPDLIAKSNLQVKNGLSKIAELAPTKIKGQLQASFDSQLLNQNEQYQKKMIGQQRQDQTNNMQDGLELSVKQAYELGASGDNKGSKNAADQAKMIADSAKADRLITPLAARVYKESAEQATLDGTYTNLATKAYDEKKLGEFEKQYAEHKPANMTNKQWVNTGRAFQSQIQFIEGLKAQSENLQVQQMANRIALNPAGISGGEWATFEESVSPLKAEQVKFKYIQALKASQSSGLDVNGVIENFSNPTAMANANPKTKNAAFNQLVGNVVKNAQNNNNPISQDQAEVQVAASAGSVIPAFRDSIKNKLHSSNPQYIEAAAQQIHSLQQMEAGHALEGLNDQDHALYTMYESLRDSRDPITAARDTTAAILNQDPAVQTANTQKWSNLLHKATQGGISPSQFALSTFNFRENDFLNPSLAQVYGTDILQKFSSLYQIANGDINVAKKVTQRYVDDNYGETRINGGSNITMHPLEKVLGFQDPHAAPYIQQDIINQMNEKLIPLKKMYEDKKTNEYWETIPLSGKTHGIFTKTFDPVKIKRHMRTEGGEKVDAFNVIMMGNDFDWDIGIQTDSGTRNIYQVAPGLGILNYKPNIKAIHDSYNKANQLKQD